MSVEISLSRQKAMALKIEIVETLSIKPSFPTPLHLKSFKLSLYDQLNPSLYTPLILFYSPKIQDDRTQQPMLVHRLKTSLSDVLTRFYPFSGRIVDNVLIDCNDDGVVFFEVNVRYLSLTEVLEQPLLDQMNSLVPLKLEQAESATIPLLIQVNAFECGGIAIGLSASHKIFDGPTLSTFIRSWADTASGLKETLVPEFKIASLFPPTDSFNSLTAVKIPANHNRLIKKRFVFDASSISTLKAKIARESKTKSTHLPTSVQAVSALIWKCAMKASKTRSSISTHSVNMRKRLDPPLSESTIGNFVGYFHVYNEGPMELHCLVDQLKNGLQEFNNNYVKEVQGKDGCCAVLRSFEHLKDIFKRSSEIEIYSFVSWCGFKLNDADFGWGRPKWASVTSSPFNNIVHFMDTEKGDGIQVWINLKEEHMLVFEQDQELLPFSSPSAHLTA